jgi:hypothetical protein
VTWLQKPVSGESLGTVWNTILGPVPEAPGLDDLDELYPDRVQIEADAGPLETPLPLPLPGTLPPLDALPDLAVVVPSAEPTKKRRGRRGILLLILIGVGAGVAYTQGYLPL